jgi:hypothetical protein
MQRSIQKLLEFYTPYVTKAMDIRFQREETIGQCVAPFLFAVIAMSPLYVHHWIISIGAVLVTTFFFYTIYCTLMRMHVCRENDGSLYIPPSFITSIQIFSVVIFSALGFGFALLLALFFLFN